MTVKKKKALGKGLDLLLTQRFDPSEDFNTSLTSSSEQLKTIAIHSIVPGKYQPRSEMDPESLAELAQSIRTQGIIQPIVIRPIGEQRFEIIAGERRWRAAKQANLTEIPAVVREVDDKTALGMALIENIQREDLNPIEEALGLQRLQNEFSLKHQELAELLGKSRTAVTNLLRLLSLEESVKRMLLHGDLEMGHARALLVLSQDQQQEAANYIVMHGLTVRETEAYVKQRQEPQVEKTKRTSQPELEQLQRVLAVQLRAKVKIQATGLGRGKVVISYRSPEELNRLISELKPDKLSL